MPTRAHVGWGLLISLMLHGSGIAALSLALPRLNVRPGIVRQVEFAVLEAPAETAHAAATSAPPPPAAGPEAPAHSEPDPSSPLAAAGAPLDVAIESSPTATPAQTQPSATPQQAQPTATAWQPTAAPAAPTAAATKPTAAPASPSPSAPLRAATTRKPVAKPLGAAASPRQISSATHADPSSDGSALQRVLTQIAATTELTPDERRKAMLVVLRTWEDPSGKHSAEELIDALLKDARKARAAPAQQ